MTVGVFRLVALLLPAQMLSPGSALVGAGLGKHVALVTDGRFRHEIWLGHGTADRARARARLTLVG